MLNPHAHFLDKMSDYVLLHGLRQATLRPLAHAAGTSDRMLIYHFGSKEGVIAALLGHLVQRLTAMLDAAILPAPDTAYDLISDLLVQMDNPFAHAYTCIWLEVVAEAARNVAAYQKAANRILVHFEGWIAARLPNNGRSPQDISSEASLVLAMIEGCMMIGATGPQGAVLRNAALAQFSAATNAHRGA